MTVMTQHNRGSLFRYSFSQLSLQANPGQITIYTGEKIPENKKRKKELNMEEKKTFISNIRMVSIFFKACRQLNDITVISKST